MLAQLIHTCTVGLPLSGMRRLTVTWHKSEPPGSTRLAAPALPCPRSMLRPWIPPPRKGNSAAPLLLLGNMWEGSWMLYSLQAAGYPWLCHFCTSLDLLGPLHSLGSPSAGKVRGLGSLVLVQCPVISAGQHLLSDALQAACCHSFSPLMLLHQEASAHSINTVVS